MDRKAHVRFLPHGVTRVLGWPLVGVGMALAAWFVRSMRGVGTTICIDKPVSSLVQDGPFRYSRNPGYVALAMIYTGIAVVRNALWAILLMLLVLHSAQARPVDDGEVAGASSRRTLTLRLLDQRLQFTPQD